MGLDLLGPQTEFDLHICMTLIIEFSLTLLVMDRFVWHLDKVALDKTDVLISASMVLTFIWPWLSRPKPYFIIKKVELGPHLRWLFSWKLLIILNNVSQGSGKGGIFVNRYFLFIFTAIWQVLYWWKLRRWCRSYVLWTVICSLSIQWGAITPTDCFYTWTRAKL